MTLIELASGVGEVKRQDGTSIGHRRYDIEIWQPENTATRRGSGSIHRPLSITASIELSEAERTELASHATELLLTLEDRRQLKFSVRRSDGSIRPSAGGLRPKSIRLRTRLAFILPMFVVAAFYFSDKSGIASQLLALRATRSYGFSVSLSLIGLTVLIVGVPLAARSRDPDSCRRGVVLLAFGFVSLWVVPYLVFINARQFGWPDEFAAVMAVFAMLGAAVALLGGGFWKIADSL